MFSSGVLLTGEMLDKSRLQLLIQLIRRSFVVVPRARARTRSPSPQAASSSAFPSAPIGDIPPPSPQASSSADDSAWLITPSDLPAPGQPVVQSDYGMVYLTCKIVH